MGFVFDRSSEVGVCPFPKRGGEPYVDRCNNVRLQSAIGYVSPKDMLAGRQVEIHTERDRKLGAARQQRQSRRQQAA